MVQPAALASAVQVRQSAGMNAFPANHDLTIQVRRIGESREPMIVIDDFLSNPGALVSAATQAQWTELPPGGYPGRRSALPGAYVRSVLRRMDEPIRRQLLKTSMQLDRFDCSFSLVTRAPEELTPLQRVPHIDVATETRVAILHYLSGSEFGGTAFFRQDATDLEQVRPGDRARYLEARARDLAKLSQDDQYPTDGTPGYTRTSFCEARFNRLLVYRSCTLHSGIIDNPDLLSTDPAKGRLTANFFVDYKLAEPDRA